MTPISRPTNSARPELDRANGSGKTSISPASLFAATYNRYTTRRICIAASVPHPGKASRPRAGRPKLRNLPVLPQLPR